MVQSGDTSEPAGISCVWTPLYGGWVLAVTKMARNADLLCGDAALVLAEAGDQAASNQNQQLYDTAVLVCT